jgi:hypothetical protein
MEGNVMTQTTLQAPMRVAVPRGALIAAGLFAAAIALATRYWSARTDLRHHQRRAQEAAAVRRHATLLALHDPSMADDLFSAADRHFKED